MGSKQLGSKFLKRSQICSHTPSALNAGAQRSGATCHMAMPQCCYLAKGAKRPSHTTNTIKFDRIPFDPCNSIKRFDLCPFDQKNSTYLQPPAEMEKYQRHVLYFESLYSFKSLFLQIETTVGATTSPSPAASQGSTNIPPSRETRHIWFSTDWYLSFIAVVKGNGNSNQESGERKWVERNGSNRPPVPWVESSPFRNWVEWTWVDLEKCQVQGRQHIDFDPSQFDLSQFDLSYSTKILFDLFHSTHFMQSPRIAHIRGLVQNVASNQGYFPTSYHSAFGNTTDSFLNFFKQRTIGKSQRQHDLKNDSA